MLFNRYNMNCNLWIRYGVANMNVRNTCKIAVKICDVNSKLENEEIKPRQHPGIIKSTTNALPPFVTKTLERIIGDYPLKALLRDCRKLDQYISSRHPPPESNYISEKIEEIAKEVHSERANNVNNDRINNDGRAQEQAIRKIFSQRVYAWKELTYGKYESLVYAFGRGPKEYSILMKILTELKMRDVKFHPRSFFDFGSGVGTGMWAASTLWKQSIYEYYNVDVSREMHDLSELILREGNENQQLTLQNVYYRQFLPGVETKYDLIISSFSLFELPNSLTRKELMLNLWRKCDGYLVIVEEGSRKGTELVNEIREYLLNQNEENLYGFVFAPCPHDDKCPRIASTNDKTPCNYEVSYFPMSVGDSTSGPLTSRYSYVILKKGSKNDDASRKWPRLVRPTLLRSKHVICKLCTSNGELQEIIFTKSKHGSLAYRCAKASRWGDRLPIEIGEKYNIKSSNTE